MSVIKVKNEQGSFEEISTLTGPQGPQGNPGIGVAGGGQVNTFLAKNSSTDYDTSWKNIFDLIYPIDSIYISLGSTNPEVLFGGTWAQISGRFLLASGGGYSLGDYAGEATHTLTIEEMPTHTHQLGLEHPGNTPDTISAGLKYVYDGINNIGAYYGTLDEPTAYNNVTGGSQPHNNMPPYLVVNMWQRIG